MILSKSQIILYSIFGVVAILVIILLFGIFRSLRNTELYTNDSLIKAKDETISVIIEGRKKDSLLISEKDKNISKLLEIDSIRNVNYIQSQNVYKKINDKISNIPAYIKRISNNDDSINHAFAEVR
jgi:hypothetical protein